MAMFMVAIEATIVATALPSIVVKLGGLALYSWVFSAFLLMQAVTIPIYGKLADLYGRKYVFIFGIVVFLAGSLLCGFAWSMAALVAFRFLQGVGAGAVQPLAMTLIGDLYTMEERASVQGYLASVWGISSIVGPLGGALIVQYTSWSWVFWVNLPFGVVTIALVMLYLHEDARHQKPSIDLAGAGLIFAGLASLMLALTQGVHWGAAAGLGLLAFAGVALWLFVRQERRAADPIMHLELWQDRLIALANAATLCAGIAMIGVITFLPVYVQGVLAGSALVAGFTVSAMSVGWPIASVVTGRLLVRVGARRLARTGGCAAFLGSLVLATSIDRGPMAAGLGSFVLGIGLGILNTTFIVSIQTSVSRSQRGVATASNILMRILGNTLGAAVFGGVLNLTLGQDVLAPHLAAGARPDNLRDALGGGALQAGLATGLHIVFWAVLVFAVATLAAAWLIPDQAPGNAGARAES
jgi:EmrB/QacA subfamily drug resistance transporter